MQQQIKRSNVRYGILVFYFSRPYLIMLTGPPWSVVAPMMSKELGFDPEAMGLAFSVFGISYVIMQIPAAGCWINMVRGWSTAAR